jgi:ATP-dependent RNA helicase SUPV3L1/SUV3
VKSFQPEGVVTALLGPTNTGKTHRAVTRMLAHPTGMIGLPLRLLAREVYDRISAEKGEESVALVTGEERRVPRAPRWWVCTVEAMPVDRPVSFLAVDEVQLAGDRNRGHVFTDRLLHARGVRETMFLGSETIAPLVERLVPAAEIIRHPRRSRLTHLGPRKLGALPSRSVLVAFSASEVYALAEMARQRHGGAAVVLGALSPRTRNAQVAMFQAGEVPVMVATDAIGMGLNMDVAHVAFSSLRKFDGTAVRALSAAEVAQIAGRAGRNAQDGTFGASHTLPDIPPEIVSAVEAHAFPALTRLWWRASALDTSSVEALRASLLAPPPSPVLQLARGEEDAVTLEALLAMPEVRARADRPERVSLLWEVCQVPDFRKTLPEEHARLLARIYHALLDRGSLGQDWILRQVEHLDRCDGDIDRLATRLAHVRTWTYLGWRARWVEGAPAVQEHARAVEDRLSDALHRALTARFVDRRGMVLAAGVDGRVSGDGTVAVGGVSVGTLHGLRWRPAEQGDRAALRAAQRALGPELDDRVQRFVDAPTDAITVAPDGVLSWEGGDVARLIPGPSVLEPQVRVTRHDLLGPAAVARIERRLRAWVRDAVAAALAPLPLEAGGGLPPAVAGLCFALARGLGCVRAVDPGRFSRAERACLARLGIRLGVHHAWSDALVGRAPVLGPPPEDLRAVLWRLAHGAGDGDALARALGFVRAGASWVRVDALETVSAAVRAASRRGMVRSADLAVPAEVQPALEDLLGALGYARVGVAWVEGRRRPRAAC